MDKLYTIKKDQTVIKFPDVKKGGVIKEEEEGEEGEEGEKSKESVINTSMTSVTSDTES